MKRMSRSIITAVIVLAMLFSLIPALSPPALAADGSIKILEDDKGENISYTPTLVLGRPGSVIIKLQNDGSVSGENDEHDYTAYNIDVSLTLPDGVSYYDGTFTKTSGTVLLTAPTTPNPSTTTPLTFTDVFDLAKNEIVHIEIPLVADDTAELGTKALGITVGSSNNPYKSATEAGFVNGKTIDLNIVPVLVEVLDTVHEQDDYYDTDYDLGARLKGAGITEEIETSGTYADEASYSYENKITITNNAFYATTVNLSHIVPNGVQVTNVTGTSTDVVLNSTSNTYTNDFKRELNWEIEVGPNAMYTITYQNNIFDMYTTKKSGVNTVNSGARITDGTVLPYTTSYRWECNSKTGASDAPLSQTAVAKDIIIGKKVSALSSGGFKPDETITYDVTVSTAQYHAVKDIEIVDEFGDGLVYTGFTDHSSYTVNVAETDLAAGKNKVTLSPFRMEAGESVKFTLTAQILENWAEEGTDYYDKPVSAKDTLKNIAKFENAKVIPTYHDGVQTPATLPTEDSYAYGAGSSDDAEDSAPAPKVIKEMVSIGGKTVPDEVDKDSDDFYHLAVDDEFVVRYTYDASEVKVPQKNVALTDFYPLSSKLVETKEVSFTVTTDDSAETTETLSLGTAPEKIYDVTAAFKTAFGTMLKLGDDDKVTFGDGTDTGKTSFNAQFASLPAGTKIEVEYTLQVVDGVAVTDEKKDYSMAKLAFTNTKGAAFSDRESFPICFDAPKMAIKHEVREKKADDSGSYATSLNDVVGNKEYEFKVTVTNNGKEAAHNVELTVKLPPGLTAVNNGGFTASGNTLTQDIGTINANGGTIIKTYTATTDNPLGAGLEMKVPASLTYHKSATSDKVYPASGEPIIEDKVTLTAAKPKIKKTWYSYLADDGTPANTGAGSGLWVHAGDCWVVYQIELTVPNGVTLYNAKLTDALPNTTTAKQTFKAFYQRGTAPDPDPICRYREGTDTLLLHYNDKNKYTIDLDFDALTGTLSATDTTYTFYVEAEVASASGANAIQTQTNTATLMWDDISTTPPGAGHTHSINDAAAVTVHRPILKGTWSYIDKDGRPVQYVPSTPISITGEEAIKLTYTINNTGRSTAHGFSPMITVPKALTVSGDSFIVTKNGHAYPQSPPAGFSPFTVDNATSSTYDCYTFSEVDSLGKDRSYAITFQVNPNALPRPGTHMTITGAPGDYYTAAAQGDTRIGDKLTAGFADAVLQFPSTGLEKIITSSSYGAAPGNLAKIRPYDTLTYRVTYTLPAGTAIDDLTLTETIPDGFTWDSYSNQSDDIKDKNWKHNSSANTYSLEVGNCSATTLNPVALTYDVTVRAKEDVAVAGSSYDFVTTATGDGITAQTKKVSINIVEPSMTATLSTSNTAFKEENDTITVTATLTNSGTSAAERVTAVISFPTTGMSVKEEPAGATVDHEKSKITWSGLTVANTTDLTFTLTKTGDNNTASHGDVTLAVDYQSTEKAASKKYEQLTDTKKLGQVTPSITLENKTATYDGSEIKIDPAVTNSSGSTTYIYYTDEDCNTALGGPPVNVGTYYVKATVEARGNYTTATSEKAKLIINPKNITGAEITLGKELIYNGSEQTQTVSGVVIDELMATFGISGNQGTNATSYTLTVTGNGNFTGTQTKEFTIGKRDLTITAKDQTITYGESIATGKGQVTTATLATGDALDSVTLTPSDLNVATPNKTITPSDAVIKDGTVDVTGNYDISYDPGALTINPATITIKPDSGKSKVYYENDPTFTYTYAGNLDGQTPDFGGKLARATGETVGDYAINDISGLTLKDKGTFQASNYKLELDDSTTVIFTITPAAITCTATPYSGTYDGAAHSITVTPPTTVNNQVATVTYRPAASGDYDLTDNPTFTDAGTYTVYYKITAPNHTDHTGSSTVTITPKEISAVWGDTTTWVYDGANHAPAATATGVTGETVTLSVSGAQKDYNASAYTATASISSVSGGQAKPENYVLKNTSQTFTITKAPLTVTPNATGKTYGATDPTLTYSYTGDYETPGFNGELSRASGEDVDSYAITQGTLALADSGSDFKAANYTLKLSDSPVYFTIGTKTLTVSVNPGLIISKTYDGDAEVEGVGTDWLVVNGLENGETATASGKWAYADKNIGNNKTITVTDIAIDYGTAKDSNYSYTPTDLTTTGAITAAVPGITLQDMDKPAIYNGEAVNIGPASVTLLNGETYTAGNITYTYYTDAGCNTKTTSANGATTDGGPPKNADTYYVKATVAAHGNYAENTSAAAKLTIEPAATYVTLANKNAPRDGQVIEIGNATSSSLGVMTYTYYTSYTNATDNTLTTFDNSGATTVGGAPVNTGTYYVKVNVAADGNYRACETIAMLVIYDDTAPPSFYAITGTITSLIDAAGTRVAVTGALVELLNAENVTIGSCTTDPNGWYSFTELKNGHYKLRVSSGVQAMTLFAAIDKADVVCNGEFPYVDTTIIGAKNATVTGSAVADDSGSVIRDDYLLKDGQFAPRLNGNEGFTAAELALIGTGRNGFLLLELTADDVTETIEENDPDADTAIRNIAAGQIIGYVVDLNMYKYVWPDRNQPYDCEVTQLTAVPEIVKVTVEIPDALRGSRNLTLYRYHNNTPFKLPTGYTAGQECVVFNQKTMDIYINNFSIYALAYTPGGGGGGGGGGGAVVPDKAVTLTYISGGNVVQAIDCAPGTDYVILPGGQLPVSGGQRFLGWSLTPNGAVAFVPGDTIRLGSSATLYAVFVDSALPVLNRTDHFAYIIGYDDGKVQPESNITREEVATILLRLLTDESRAAFWSKENSFSDVAAERWSNNAISTMQKAGVIQGMDDGTFQPSAYITRAQLAAILARFDSREFSGGVDFNDIAGHWAAGSIRRSAALGWIVGYEDGSFRPEQYITRAETMTLINRVLGRSVAAEGLLDGMMTWPDNNSGAWYYRAVQEATNSHEYVRSESGEETWTQLLPARDWSELEKQWSTGE